MFVTFRKDFEVGYPNIYDTVTGISFASFCSNIIKLSNSVSNRSKIKNWMLLFDAIQENVEPLSMLRIVRLHMNYSAKYILRAR